MCLSEQLETFFFEDKYEEIKKTNITSNIKDSFERASKLQFINELSNTSLSCLITIIIDKSDPKITTDNIPQYSSYIDGTKKLINILRMAGDIGPTFKEIGVYLLGSGKSDTAYVKYGENHAKLAREYGLVYFIRSGSYKVYLTKLGKIVEQLLNNHLSKSTAQRRKNNVLTIINMINNKIMEECN